MTKQAGSVLPPTLKEFKLALADIKAIWVRSSNRRSPALRQSGYRVNPDGSDEEIEPCADFVEESLERGN